jgi:hypothetical protein
MAKVIRNWLLRQLNSNDVLDGVSVTVKLAVEELGAKTVAEELRRIARQLEGSGNFAGWQFPRESERAAEASPVQQAAVDSQNGGSQSLHPGARSTSRKIVA